jgi:hypothetical protein
MKSYEVQLVNHTGHVGDILAIYAPIMIYTAPVRNDFWCVQIHYLGKREGGWALEIVSFLGPVKWLRANNQYRSNHTFFLIFENRHGLAGRHVPHPLPLLHGDHQAHGPPTLHNLQVEPVFYMFLTLFHFYMGITRLTVLLPFTIYR